MKLKVNTSLVLALFLIGMLTLAFNIQLVKAEPTTIIVPDHYAKMQWAIGNASDGDIIFVRAGTYYEHVVMNKRVALIGENKFNTIIDGGITETVINVTANNVNITGFTVRHSGSGRGIDYGIYICNSSWNNISYNIVTNNFNGIWLEYSNNNTLIGNVVFSNDVGIYVSKSGNNSLFGNNVSKNIHGIELIFSSNNIISGNNVSSNSWEGIWLWGSNNNVLCNNIASSNMYYGIALDDSSNNLLSGNIASSTVALYGIFLRNSGNNLLSGNAASSNYDGGVYLYYSDNNTLSGNMVSLNKYFGMHVQYSSNTMLSGNIASHNGHGIWFWHSHNNIITGNFASNNKYGIDLGYSGNSKLCVNIASNNEYGIYLRDSSNNVIFHNNFINNTQQVYNYNSMNTWDNGYPSGGNYWSDHICIGNPSNGSQPYIIDANNMDRYPFQDSNGWLKKAITAIIDIDPDTLNLKSKGEWITCYIEFPEGSNVSDIDVSAILLNDTVPAEWSDIQDNVLMAKFNRTAIISLLDVGNQTIKIMGQLKDGAPFEGADTIRAIHHRSHLFTRLIELDMEWAYASTSERSTIFNEIDEIDGQWPYAPP